MASSAFCQSNAYSEWYLKTSDSLDIFVKEVGTGDDTVIVVHGGFGANHEYMLEAIEGLEDQFFFVLYDQRGSLMSPAPTNKLTFQKNVEDLNTLVNELGIKEAKIICHSMGTLVGMEFLKQHPQDVKSITLMGAIPTQSDSISSIFDQRYYEQLDFMQNRPEAKLLTEPYEKKNGSDSTQIGYYNYDSKLTDKEQTELWRIQFASVNIYRLENWNQIKGGRSYYKGDDAMMAANVNWNYDYRNQLNNIDKATIIMGDHDFLDFNGEKHKSLVQNHSNIHVEMIKNAGHNIWTDNPIDFRKALKKSITSIK